MYTDASPKMQGDDYVIARLYLRTPSGELVGSNVRAYQCELLIDAVTGMGQVNDLPGYLGVVTGLVFEPATSTFPGYAWWRI